MAQRAKQDLTTGPIGLTLLTFALPTLATSVLQSLNGSINAVWVGRFLGEEALAAASNANLILFLTMSFVFGFGMAGTILVGQAWGRKDVDAVRRVIGSVIGGFLALAFVMAALGWIFAPQILDLMGVAPGAREFALTYLRIIFLAIPSGMVLMVFMMALRGTGDAMTPMWVMGISAVIDCTLNPVLILGLGPFPEMGIAGAATATLVTNVVGLAGTLVYVYARDLPVRLRGPELAYLKPDPALVRRIMGMGLPMGMQMIVMSLSSVTMLGLVNRQGVDTTAAYGVALQLWTYVAMPAMALSGAVSAMAAQNIGAGKWDRIGRITGYGIFYNLAGTGALVLLLAIADRPALALFLGGDSPALPIAQHIQLIATWSYIIAGVTMVLFGTVRANGAVWVPLIILTVTMIPIRVGFAVAGQDWLGADAIWAAFPASSLVSLLLAAAYYRWGKWRKPKPGMTRPGPDRAVEEANASLDPDGKMTPTG
ncbi:MATE family efflux transporter [Stakelama tenebrarum]|uniref:MATE family efflux transporter n=1 Tax=Stakelama tenebrarum TaxID=2711215 RepID=A0A6G6Y6R2_9SPHN|nr:MATE family efflux transporter [Sphingosinithalassobacter tenebrarum]QIG80634.1 MATE family efflux transporter [Sphingosinithalassobacter tenebrarum]